MRLWVDEIEKMLAGSGSDGSNDSGVSARVGGSILSWMADKKAPVFVVATANNQSDWIPAYVRRGRFDERFFIDLPGPNTRETSSRPTSRSVFRFGPGLRRA